MTENPESVSTVVLDEAALEAAAAAIAGGIWSAVKDSYPSVTYRAEARAAITAYLSAVPQDELREERDRYARMYMDCAERSGEAMVKAFDVAAEKGAWAGIEWIADYLNGIDYVDDESIESFERAKSRHDAADAKLAAAEAVIEAARVVRDTTFGTLIGDATVRVPMTTWQDLATALATHDSQATKGQEDG